ncbi:hypothetical protein THMIRHAS_15290 [Thiosulfatimonas sediminis]|uniref:Glycosyl transferase family 2 n=1 Tax=Thiosulfatimonas sediminis TaxID=2675054 RepID=A0A6F8PVN1_9GAMM|nr:glycosyltransferase family 2 protein [Thiosulfatimonas sediminis]BBP46156.1 hypothetical protein THMIRHAS_15290 [Thiosulfatimonas sediminis]
MKFGILTMSRGDSKRLEHWIRYHDSIGFTDYFIILDNPNDDSEAILEKLSDEFNINVFVKAPSGPYYDDVCSSELWNIKKKWLADNKNIIDEMNFPINDEISFRQYKYFPEIMKRIENNNLVDWLSIIDVDEYIDLIGYEDIAEMVSEVGGERIRLLNFNYDTSSSFPIVKPVTETATFRWDRQDIIEFGSGWEYRCKSIVKYDKALPLVSVHAISKGSFKVVEHTKAKLNHYKYPIMNNIPYTVDDPLKFNK